MVLGFNPFSSPLLRNAALPKVSGNYGLRGIQNVEYGQRSLADNPRAEMLFNPKQLNLVLKAYWLERSVENPAFKYAARDAYQRVNGSILEIGRI